MFTHLTVDHIDFIFAGQSFRAQRIPMPTTIRMDRLLSDESRDVSRHFDIGVGHGGRTLAMRWLCAQLGRELKQIERINIDRIFDLFL